LDQSEHYAEFLNAAWFNSEFNPKDSDAGVQHHSQSDANCYLHLMLDFT